MAEKQSLEFNSNIDTGEAAAYLEALARGLRDGHVLIESGDKSFNMEVGEGVDIELEAKSNPEKGKSSVELKLSWRVEEPVEEGVPPTLLITSGVGATASNDSD
jgi:amphi-Trp domain-containing protein